MRKTKLLLAVAGWVSLASVNALAGNMKVVANTSVKADTISLHELKRVYLQETSSLDDGTHVEPVLERSGAAHEAFLRQCLGQSDDQLQTYYRSLVFTGKGSMPKAVNSDAEVVAYVARTRGAIGYVSSDASADGVKTLSIAGAEGSAERKLITRVEPEYPEVVHKNHIGGIVRLEVTIAANGSVERVKTLGGNPVLVEPAETAVRKWVYAAGHSRTTTEVVIPFNPDR
jgi:TonB family protein